MPFYFSAMILLSGQWQAGNWRKSLKIGLIIGYLMVSLTYALPPLIQVFNLHNTPVDPTFRFRHAQDLVQAIDSKRQELLINTDSSFVMVSGHRYLASQLAFYLPDHPKVFRYDDNGQVTSQYEVWPGPVDFIGKTAFIVSDKEEVNVPDELKSVFKNFHKVGEVVNPMKKNSRYNLFLGETLKYWPPIKR
jgi:hypothetical protein